MESDNSEHILIERQEHVLYVTFDRPQQLNAMTWSMYEGLASACERAEHDPGIRVVVLRGSGDQAFVAGTDIAQFNDFETGYDGLNYEYYIQSVCTQLERLAKPTIAVIMGRCVGAGLIIAAACDLRIATPESSFGVPIAQTVGNCLSTYSCSLLVSHLGPARTLDLILNARHYTGKDLASTGFTTELVEQDEVDVALARTVERLTRHAPLTMWAAKEAIYRLRSSALPDDGDIITTVYDSADFRRGIETFVDKSEPWWTGQ